MGTRRLLPSGRLVLLFIFDSLALLIPLSVYLMDNLSYLRKFNFIFNYITVDHRSSYIFHLYLRDHSRPANRLQGNICNTY